MMDYGVLILLINGVFINLSISSKKINNSLAIGLKKGYVPHNQLSPASKNRDGFFLKEQSICQSGILQFATLKIFMKGEYYYD